MLNSIIIIKIITNLIIDVIVSFASLLIIKYCTINNTFNRQ
jgi:hypothetical protein